MKPGEIYLADLYEAGSRPVIVVSRESLNRGGYAVVVPITSEHFERRSKLRNCLPLPAGRFGMTKDSVAQCEAILTVERSQVDVSRGAIGQPDEQTVRALVHAIGCVIDSECEPV
jgi:mRNA-degrading endonuclease toxin of MazEF toxin-antitoxin module